MLTKPRSPVYFIIYEKLTKNFIYSVAMYDKTINSCGYHVKDELILSWKNFDYTKKENYSWKFTILLFENYQDALIFKEKHYNKFGIKTIIDKISLDSLKFAQYKIWNNDIRNNIVDWNEY